MLSILQGLLPRRALAALMGCLPFLPLGAQPVRSIRIAAASDLRGALEAAQRTFEQERPGMRCSLTFGSSGTFFAQLSQRAPFDLFLSADMDYPRRLADQGLGVRESLFVYGVGRVVVWVPKASPIPVEQLGLQAVVHPSVRKVAMANPRHAPYGRAAEAALKAAGLLPAVQAKLVLGENVSQAAQFVQGGGAEVGLIALSLAASPQMQGQGRYWTIPEDRHPRLEQGGVILAWAQDPEAARAFREFLVGPKGAAILKGFGFAPPAGR